MARPQRRHLGATFAAAALAASLCGGDRDQRLEEFREAMRNELAKVEAAMAQPDPTPTTRDLPNAALAKLALGGHPRDAEKLVLAAFAHQDMDPQSAAYGTIPWQIGHPEIKDANSIEFCTQPVGPILLGYRGQLSDEFTRALEPHMRAAFAAIRRHNVAVTYTNIFLMKAVNLVLAGEAIGDASAAQDGYALLDRWIAHTREAGIGEFDSPNYYAVDLNSLLMGYLYAGRPGAREKFRRILDFFWGDIAGNYFAGRGTLSGPHSRGYDFLGGHESVELFLYHEGIRPRPSTVRPAIGRVYLLQSELAGGYRPPPAIVKLASIPERVVRSRWRAEPGRDRYNYITRDFALGSTSGHYGTHDKLINLELASDAELPAIYVAPDITDQPYGKLQFKDRSGHNKPVHAPLNAVSVQEKGVLLTLLDLDPSALGESAAFSTNVVLPARADELRLDGRKVAVAGAFETRASIDSVVGVRAGRAAVAIRIFHAGGAGGQTPSLILKADAAGLAHGALRYAAYHYRGDARKLEDAHVRVGILILAGRAAEFPALLEKARRAMIEQQEDAAAWKVKAAIGALTLEAARDRNTRAVLYRRVNGAEPPTFVLKVNDLDLAGVL